MYLATSVNCQSNLTVPYSPPAPETLTPSPDRAITDRLCAWEHITMLIHWCKSVFFSYICDMPTWIWRVTDFANAQVSTGTHLRTQISLQKEFDSSFELCFRSLKFFSATFPTCRNLLVMSSIWSGLFEAGSEKRDIFRKLTTPKTLMSFQPNGKAASERTVASIQEYILMVLSDLVPA